MIKILKPLDTLETRIGVSPRAHTQARGQGQEVARQAGVGQEEPQEVASRVFLCYSRNRTTPQARAEEGDAQEEPQAGREVAEGGQARGQVAEGRQARGQGQVRRRSPT